MKSESPASVSRKWTPRPRSIAVTSQMLRRADRWFSIAALSRASSRQPRRSTYRAARTMLEVWSDEADERDRRYAEGPRLQNTSGDPILFTEDSFIFDEGDRDEVIRRLAAIRGAGAVGITEEGIEIPFTTFETR